MRGRPRRLCAYVVGVGAYSLAHGGAALAAGLLAQALAGHGEGLLNGPSAVLGPSDPRSLLVVGLCATVVKALASVFLAFLEARLASDIAESVSRQAVEALLTRGHRRSAPQALATLTSRTREVELAVSSGVTLSLKSAAQLVPLCLALILLSSRLAVVGMLALLPFAISLAGLRRRWRRSVARSQTLRDELLVDLDDLVRNLDLWRCYGAGPELKSALRQASTRVGRATARTEAGRAALSGLNEILAVLALLGCFALAPALGIAFLDGRLLGFFVVFFLSYRPLRDLGDARAWVARGGVALDAIRDLCAPEVTVPDVVGPGRRYEETPEALVLDQVGARDFGPRTSLVAEPGSITVIVGPTGSGKSTLLRVLLGLEEPAGSIHYGKLRLRTAQLGPESRPFAWVPQHAPLVEDTVLGNVMLCGASEKSARDALDLVGAHDLARLADIVVGPSGRQLSGGEKRLIAVARAVASRLPVLLLDEPTEGLDEASERAMLEALERLHHGRTLLIVTHRERVRDLADRIVPIGSGDRAPEAAE